MSRSRTVLMGCSCYTLLSLTALADDPSPSHRDIPLPRLAIKNVESSRSTLATRWERFDAEFGIHEDQSSVLVGSLLRAKYGVDLVTFSIKTLTDTLSDATELRYSRGRIRRASTADDDPAPRSSRHVGPVGIEDARLKFDFELASGKPHLGVRLVLPFGN